MIRKFMSLEPEKRERIINAALSEFAQKGYKNASTNEIVKNANISKGLLFHYFNNKKSLFLFLLDYSIEIFVDEFYSRLNFDDTDMLNRWKQIVIFKIDLIQRHLDLYEFLLASMTDDSVDIKHELENRNQMTIDDFYQRILSNIDTSVFKEGLDAKRVSQIIVWAIQGFSNNELEKLRHCPGYKLNFDLNAIKQEFDEYIDLLKNAFYK